MAVSHYYVPWYMWGTCPLYEHAVTALTYADFKAENHVTYSALIGGSLRDYICLLGRPCCRTPSLNTARIFSSFTW